MKRAILTFVILGLLTSSACARITVITNDYDWTVRVGGRRYGLTGIDARTLSDDFRLKAETRFYFGSRRAAFPMHIYWVVGLATGLSTIIILLPVIIRRLNK